MDASQVALLDELLGIAYDACVRSPAATASAAHLKAVLFDAMLGRGGAIVEPASRAGFARVLRLVDDVVRIERVAVPRSSGAPERPSRPADLQLHAPARLRVELHARGGLMTPPREAPRLLHERLQRLTTGQADALVLVCDRRSYDGIRRGPRSTAGDDAPAPSAPSAAHARLWRAILPASASLVSELAPHETAVAGGARFIVMAAVTPMVFGVQRIVAGVRIRGVRRGPGERAAEVQLDAFGSGG